MRPADLVTRAIRWLSGEEGAALVDLAFNNTKHQAWRAIGGVPGRPRGPRVRGGRRRQPGAPPEIGIETLGVLLGSPAHVKVGLAKELASHTAMLTGAALGKLESRAQLPRIAFSISLRARDTARFARPDLLICSDEVHATAILGGVCRYQSDAT